MISCHRSEMLHYTSRPGVSLALLSVVVEGWHACSSTTHDESDCQEGPGGGM